MVIRRFGPLSCAKIAGTLYAILGVVIGIFFSLIALIGAAAGGDDRSGFGALLGVGAVIALPLMYGGLGFVGALVGAWLYNVLSGQLGGIEVEVQ